MATPTAIVFLFLVCSASAFFYLPGVAPRDYQPGDLVDLKVNKITSIKTQVPFDYYSLPWCRPENVVEAVENLGEILKGDRIENSCYSILAVVPISCRVLCEKEYTTKHIKQFATRIDEEYRHHWILDNLPAAMRKTLRDQEGNVIEVYEEGFPIGDKTEDKKYALYNHISLNIWYHEEGEAQGARIVGFEVEPKSIKHGNYQRNDPNGFPKTCTASDPEPLLLSRKDKSAKVVYTYSVSWFPSDIPWASRWDVYLRMTDDQIHWFSIINSLMIVLFLSGMVAMIMMRTLHRDFQKYSLETFDPHEEVEETGWKLVHGDVFRPPNNPLLLSVFVGTGAQVFSMFLITLVFAVLGFLSPANRGSLMTAMIILLVIMGMVAGYTAARLCKMFHVQNWKRCAGLTAFLFPGIVVVIFLIVNFGLVSVNSSGAVPFQTLIALFTLWFGISTPLVFIGAYYGFRAETIESPLRTNQIPRQVPQQVWYFQTIPVILMGGILPFGAVFIELFFILSSIWQHQFYYMFSFLFLVFFILVLTCSEISIVLCYFQLCSEDYHWWWRAYLTSGASAFYVFAYSIFYFCTKLEIVKFLSGVLFFGYTLIISLAFFVLTGAIGFISSLIFVRKIYAAVKVD